MERQKILNRSLFQTQRQFYQNEPELIRLALKGVDEIERYLCLTRRNPCVKGYNEITLHDGPNQSSFCSVENSLLPYHCNPVKREKERTQPIIKKPWMQEEGQRKDTHTPSYWTDGRPTIKTELLNWRTVGLRRGSSTSTASPILTSVMKHLTDSDYDMKAHSS